MKPDDSLRNYITHWRSVPRGRPENAQRPGPGQESVWDYPRPPALEPVADTVRVEFNGVAVARSDRAFRVCETASPPAYYVPPEDVRRDLLAPETHRTICEWKGQAVYWTLRVGGVASEAAAWSYPDPLQPFTPIRDYLAFFAGRVDGCWVGDVRVIPQAGDFYGGWVTPNVVGPFKGEPGTEGW